MKIPFNPKRNIFDAFRVFTKRLEKAYFIFFELFNKSFIFRPK